MRQKLAVERAPVDADADGFAVFQRRLDDGAELAVLLVLEADVAGIDAVFVESFGARGVFAQELVADVMEVADQRHVDAAFAKLVANVRYGLGRFVAVDGDAHEFGPGAREVCDLLHRRCDVRRVGVGHRLDDDRSAAADLNAADLDRDGLMTGFHRDAVGLNIVMAFPNPAGRVLAPSAASRQKRYGRDCAQGDDDTRAARHIARK